MISIILAAGKGTRMGSSLPKVLHCIQDRPLICHVLDAARLAGVNKHCVVVGHGASEVMSSIAAADIIFANQLEQKGTGHAVLCTQEVLQDCLAEIALILCGDTPCLNSVTLQKFCNSFLSSDDDLHVLSTTVENPAGYGRIIRNAQHDFLEICEQADLKPEKLWIKEINTGIYAGRLGLILDLLRAVKNNNAQGEYYLTDIISLAADGNLRVKAINLGQEKEFIGVNTPRQLHEAALFLAAKS